MSGRKVNSVSFHTVARARPQIVAGGQCRLWKDASAGNPSIPDWFDVMWLRIIRTPPRSLAPSDETGSPPAQGRQRQIVRPRPSLPPSKLAEASIKTMSSLLFPNLYKDGFL